MELFRLERGDGPVLVNVPHAGTVVPDGIREGFADAAHALPDTDWYVDELYSFAPGLGAGLMAATHSRYVVDLNRPPDNASLYDRHGTGLVPAETFSGDPVYRQGRGPGEDETRERVERHWAPYHAALEAELTAIQARHGFAILLDGHSILSRVPALFEGQLPHLNLGSYGGRSAHASLVQSAMEVLESSEQFSSVLDGRFQGGYITRHHGRPGEGRHALQLEMAQCIYMNEHPPRRDQAGMQKLSDLLACLVQTLMEWRP